MAKVNLANPYEVELMLDSLEGAPLHNVQNWAQFLPQQVTAYETTYRRNHPKITERTKGCTDVYNCHGLVFASRRTKLYRTVDLRQLMREDGYEKIVAIKDVLPGDIIIYVYAATAQFVGGDIFHSGIVIEPAGELGQPKVFSKWGPWAEVIHYASDCPYAREEDVVIEYHRFLNPN